MKVVETARETLADWTPPSEDTDLHAEYVDFAEDVDHTFRETSVEQHLTVSAFVFSPDLSQVLLCFHKKGQFWLQLGGHVEPEDASLFAAAMREAAEESGLAEIEPVVSAPADLSRHGLSRGFGTCRVHWDIGFGFTADAAGQIRVSDESEDVRWWPVDRLPTPLADGVERRVAKIRSAFA